MKDTHTYKLYAYVYMEYLQKDTQLAHQIVFHVFILVTKKKKQTPKTQIKNLATKPQISVRQETE